MNLQQLIDMGIVASTIALIYLGIYFVLLASARTTDKLASLSFANVLYQKLKNFPTLIWFSATAITLIFIPGFLGQYQALKGLLLIIFSFILILSLIRFINSVVNSYFKAKTTETENESKENFYKYIALIIRTIFWSTGIIIYLTLIGVDINSLFSFLGLTSLGLSFALRNTIKDALNSFIIVFQKPFNVGDYVKSVDQYGQVIETNLKNTKLRTIDEKIVTIPNSHLMDKPLTNFKDRNQIKVRYDLSVATPKLGRYERKITRIESRIYRSSKRIEKDSIEIISTSVTSEKHTYRVTLVLDLNDRSDLADQNREMIHLIFSSFRDEGLDIQEVALDQKPDPFAR